MPELVVSSAQRFAKMRAHTATHLLHAALVSLFPDTKQAGSLVDDDYLRFDFYVDRSLTDFEVENIEKQINIIIRDRFSVKTYVTSLEEAKKQGAKAFFEDTYRDEVRMVSIMNGDAVLSRELCGGTHVSWTSEIWAFMIAGQESVASGIRRIEAYVWPRVAEEAIAQKKELTAIASDLWSKVWQSRARAQKLIQDHKDLQGSYESIRDTSVILILNTSLSQSEKSNWISEEIDLVIDTKDHNILASLWFKDIVSVLKQWQTDRTVLMRWEQGAFVLLSWSDRAKSLAKKFQLRWWWSDRLVQWKDEKVYQIL